MSDKFSNLPTADETLKALANWPNAKDMHQPLPLAELKVPKRVIFMEIPSGKVFFDCHPAEARMAIDSVHKARREGLNIDKKKKADFLRNAAIKSKSKKILMPLSDCVLTINSLNKMFTEIEKHNVIVEALVINTMNYADIRNWGKTLYDESTTEEIVTIGVTGRVWTADIIIDNKIKKGTICLVGTNEKGIPLVKKFNITPKPIDKNKILEMNKRMMLTQAERAILKEIDQAQRIGSIAFAVFPSYVFHIDETKFLVDIAFPDVKVAVECDSAIFPSDTVQIEDDCLRDKMLSDNGWTVVRFTDLKIQSNISEVINTIIFTINCKSALNSIKSLS